MKLLINKERFIKWYFDHEIQQEFFHRHNVLGELSDKGVFSISLQSILDDVGYLPESVVEDGQEVLLNDLEEIDMLEYDEIVFS